MIKVHNYLNGNFSFYLGFIYSQSKSKGFPTKFMGGISDYRLNFGRYYYLRNRSALAVNCCVIIHCLEVSCKEDQITSAQRE